MPAILRAGGELEYGYQNPIFVNGTRTSLGVTLVTGRTGGKAWRCYPFSGGGSYDLNGAWVSVKQDHETPALRPIPEEDQWIISRVYYKINQLPAMSGIPFFGQVPGLPIMMMGPTGRGVGITNDGFVSAATSITSALVYTPDVELVMPLGEWVMIESASTHSLTVNKHVVRVTIDGQDPVIVFCRMHLDPDDIAIGDEAFPHPQLAFGASPSGNPGAGFVIECDDTGINFGGEDAHGTWLGPGEVRNARPSADVSFGTSFVSGGINDRGDAVLGRTITNHPAGTPPSDFGAPGGLDPAMPPFWSTLDNDPILNPAAAPATRVGRRGYEIGSAGNDYHEHSSPPPPTVSPSGTRWIYVYGDWPRVGSAGDELVVECDASDQSGAVSYAMPWVIGTQTEGIEPFTPHDGSGFMAFYADYEPEGAPTPEDETDRAVQNLEDTWATGGAVDAAWTEAAGRITEDPTLPGTPVLHIRREDDTECTPEGDNFRTKISEFRLLGAGIVYESGFVEQPPMPTTCSRLMCWL